MKILITTGIFEPEIGGPATLAPIVARMLVERGHTVHVITYASKKSFASDKQYSFTLTRVVRRNKIFNYVHFFFAVLWCLKNVDMVYSLDWFSAGVPVMAACRLKKKNYCVRVGGGYIWEKYLSQNKKPMPLKDFYEEGLYKKYPVMFWCIKKVLQNASAVIFNSFKQRELYEQYYGIEKTKTYTILNAAEEKKMDVSSLVPVREKEIIFAGRFIAVKNVSSALRAFAQWGGVGFKFTLIGEGPKKRELQELVRDLAISDKVDFLPPMKKDDLYRRIINCYYVILPSWTDIFPNLIMECISRGIPFLLTKENYLPFVQEFRTIDPRSVDDIAFVMQELSDENAYQRYLADLRKINFENPWTRIIDAHEEIFKTCLQK